MKIQAINTNTNFKGLFTDKSAQNGGNWFMEYRPYSWESNNTGKMANKVRVDEYASTLPDNEEIFTREKEHIESSKDILGTESYYKAADGTMRRTIIQGPSMNREESLEVLNKKLNAFLKLKQATRKTLEESFAPIFTNLNKESDGYNRASQRHQESIFGRSQERARMDVHKSGILAESYEMYQNIKDYIRLIASIDNVKEKKEKNITELALINRLKESDLFIDISRRDGDKPNEALIQALKNRVAAAAKILCLPDGLISMDAILSKLDKDASVEEIVKFVERKIKLSI